MRRRACRCSLLVASALIVLPLAGISAHGEPRGDVRPLSAGVPISRPPPPPITMPGRKLGEQSTRWLGPYVLYARARVGEAARSTITWLGPKGEVLREFSGKGLLLLEPGYVWHGGKAYAVNGDWTVSPLPRRNAERSITSSRDSVAYLVSYHPSESEVAADLYLHGKLTASVGPFLAYRGGDFRLGEDGSMSLLTRTTREKGTPEVLAFSSTGQLRARGECDETASHSIVAPGARGVLVDHWKDGPVYTFYGTDGSKVDLPTGPNLEFMGWLPDSTRALFETSIDDDREYQLVECTTGATLWRLEFPDSGHVAPIGADRGYIFFPRWNPVPGLLPGMGVRSLYAVEATTGNPIAEWVPSQGAPCRREANWPTLLRLDDALYFVTDTEFAQIDLDDIIAHRNGWNAWAPTQTSGQQSSGARGMQ